VSEIQYVGHATCVLDLDGTRVITDPVLRRRLAHLRRVVPLDRSRARDADLVVISHAHLDHLDVPSLRRLGRDVPIVIPRGAGRVVTSRGFTHVTEVEPGEELEIAGLTLRVTEAVHDGGRPPFRVDSVAVGYVLRRAATSVYFAGDTDLFDGMDGLEPGLDVALVPIWGWGLDLGRGLHLGPEPAAEAVRRLQPRIAIPIHWGTLLPAHRGLLSLPATLRDPAHEFASAVASVAPGVGVRILQPGEALVLEGLAGEPSFD
jgi:L-ascorbate metabolism protein UlaG (beta-lactamase superfamily)